MPKILHKRYHDNDIRYINKDGDVMFIGIDICKLFGLKYSTQEIASYVADENKLVISRKDVPELPSTRAKVINRKGIQELSIRTNPDTANEFIDWISTQNFNDDVAGTESNDVVFDANSIEVDAEIVDENVDTNAIAIKEFVNDKFGEIRCIMIDGDPWFVGKDVAEVLGYERPTKAIVDRVDVEDRNMIDGKTQSQIGIELGQRGGWIINESGLYSLILSSKLDTAKDFKHWVTKEVLPSIRKTGAYIQNQEPESDVDALVKGILAAQRILKEKDEQIHALTESNEQLSQENEAMHVENKTWDRIAIVNALVRSYANYRYSGKYMYSNGWNDFHRDMNYKYHINLKSRKAHDEKGKYRSEISYLRGREEEEKAVKVAESMCKHMGLDIVEIINSVNANTVSTMQ